MSVACVFSEEYFLCAICLDVFNRPVTVPCGHNFCRKCIIQNWKINRKYQCPVCKCQFGSYPELNINTCVSEMTTQFRLAMEETSDEGEVPCDICTGRKKKALKSCLACVASYCEMHLEWHQKVSGLKKHKLIDPVENIQDRLCAEHDELMDMFCKTEQTCICKVCARTGHNSHLDVPMRQECDERKQDLLKRDAEVQEKIRERQRKVQEIAHTVNLSKETADKWIADIMQLFPALVQSVETSLNQLTDTINMKHETVAKEAEDLTEELNQEISRLIETNAEAKRLAESEDHFQFLQFLPHLNTLLPTRDWMEVSLHQPAYKEAVAKALAQLKETFSEEAEQLLKEEQGGPSNAVPRLEPLNSEQNE